MRESLLDRAISWVSPAAGIRRMRARVALDSARSVLKSERGYDGAGKDVRGLNWRTPSTSGNAELVPALSVLRNRSRDLVRNNPFIKHALRVWAANMIGTGIVAKFAKPRVQALWNEWIAVCDADGLLTFGGLQLMVARALRESGECLVRFRIRLDTDGLDVPLQLQVLESDYLDTSRTGMIEGGFCVAGVQFDRIGRRVGYWLFDQHPGDIVQIASNVQSRLVPANEVLHVFDPTDRPNTVRGLPEFAVAIWAARDSDEYREAQRVRKKIEACFAAFVVSDSDMGQPTGRRVPGERTGPTPAPVEEIVPGMISHLNPDEDIRFTTPSPVSDYEQFMRVEHRGIAAGSDVTYEQMTGDFSQVNFTSGRMGKIEFKRILEQQQWLIFIPRFCDAVANRFVEVAYLAGKTQKASCPRDWTAPRIEMTDPQRETAALAMQVDERFISRQEAQRQMGQDPATMDREIAEDPYRNSTPASPSAVDAGEGDSPMPDDSKPGTPAPKQD
ncbi:phage portal protein [Paraburkholderia sp. J11-2]|uniref:phage portal protein n=1 Tax=Paraburkholderia sp. J11-2 TaxID=2805431 RepID=UPI002AB64471|nr:phage portal protein [Paraburkholderia sp. J11-2]